MSSHIWKTIAKGGYSYQSYPEWVTFYLKTTGPFFLIVVGQKFQQNCCCSLLMLDAPCIPFNLQGGIPSSVCSKSFSELFSGPSWTILLVKLAVDKWKKIFCSK